jgi:hypothetical protein
VNWKSQFIVVSADFEKQQQYFDKKILLYQNIAIVLYLFMAILLVKIDRLTRAFLRIEIEKRKFRG